MKSKLKLNWKQAKKKYPSLKKYGDTDLDGTLNYKDCKPFDPANDGLFGRIANVLSRGKIGQTKEQYQAEKLAKNISKRKYTEKRVEKFERRALQKKGYVSPARRKYIEATNKAYSKMPGRSAGERFTKFVENPTVGGTQIVTRSVKRGAYSAAGGAVTFKPSGFRRGGKGAGVGRRTGRVGRPKGSYTYRHPVTGKPIHVWEYRKVVRALKNRNQILARQRDQLEQMRLARQGIPPEQAKVIADARQIRQALSSGNQPQPQQVPVEVQQQVQQQQAQAELQRIQQRVVPWQQRAAMNRLRRQQQIAQMDAYQQQMQQQKAEVSLLDGRTYVKDNTAMQRRERWTYS